MNTMDKELWEYINVEGFTLTSPEEQCFNDDAKGMWGDVSEVYKCPKGFVWHLEEIKMVMEGKAEVIDSAYGGCLEQRRRWRKGFWRGKERRELRMGRISVVRKKEKDLYRSPFKGNALIVLGLNKKDCVKELED